MRSGRHQLGACSFSQSFRKRKNYAVNSAVRSTIDHRENIHLGPHQQGKGFTAPEWRSHSGRLYNSTGCSATLRCFSADEDVFNGRCRHPGLGFFRSELHHAILDR